MKKINYLYSIILSIALLACQPGETVSQEQNVNVVQGQETIAISLNNSDWAEKMVQEPGVILDVRTENEFLQGHIEEGQLVDISSSDFIAKLESLSLNKSKAIYVYCRSGNRSKKAMTILKDQGFIEIYELDRGVLGWEREGKKLVK